MPLVSSSIPNLVNGVSQQPSTLRLASQAELQENGLSTVAQGLKKRPPTKHVKRLGPAITGSAYIHTINRDTNEHYEVIITNGDLKVYDIDGNEKTVNFPNGKTYLNSTDPATTFRSVTVADYTFIVNKAVTVQKSATLIAARPYEGLVVVKSGQYGKAYNVLINGVSKALFTTPNGTTAADAPMIATDYIAGQLLGQLVANGVSASLNGSTIYISSATDFTLTSTDGYSGAAMSVAKGKVQRYSDLPTSGTVDGFTIKIAGDVTTKADDYWVKFESSASGGVWRETVAPGISTGFVASTMPMGLVREADGTFTFKVLAWSNRIAGDLESAPDPSFVGKRIREVFFYRNRLSFLADEAVILSEAGDFFNFYPTTVTTLLDSDPIDLSASHTKVSLLNFAVPFNKKLLLFSSQTQFSFESGDILTAKTASIKPTTEFECSSIAAPIGVGRNIYFTVPKGNFEGVRAYFIANTADTEDAADVTGHVPRYIPEGVYKMTAALNDDFLTLLTTSERNVVYVYKFYWNNNEKLQSSWSRWVFPETDQILSAEFIQSEMFLVINRPSGLYLESLSIALNDIADEEPYVVHLDRKVIVAPVPGSFDGTYTTLNLGWTPNDGQYAAVVANDQPKHAGIVIEVTSDGKVKGDFSNCALIVGCRYLFRYRFSTLLVRQNSQQGQKADTVGRLQIRRMMVNYSETGYFQAKVTPYGRETYTYTYIGKTLGLPSADLGLIGIEDGQFSFGVNTRNDTAEIELVSDSPMPCTFMSADWEGYYVRRSQAV